jgi:glycine/serine hydroxymethyltransferase
MEIRIGTLNLSLTLNGKDEKQLAEVVKTISNVVKGVEPVKGVGVTHRPTVADLERKKEPEKVREEKEAMKESLDAFPELVAHRELLKKYQVKGIMK